MGSMNKAIIIGNLGKDAELRYTNGGTAVATFSVATTEKFKGQDNEWKEDTQWHNIVLWGKSAESLYQYLLKGKQVAIEGRLQTRKWTDKEGRDRWTTEIKADRVTLLGGGGRSEDREDRGSGGGGGRSRRRQTEEDVPSGPVDEDDIPF